MPFPQIQHDSFSYKSKANSSRVLVKSITRRASFSNSPPVRIVKCQTCCLTGPIPLKIGRFGLLYPSRKKTHSIHSMYSLPLANNLLLDSPIIYLSSALASTFERPIYFSGDFKCSAKSIFPFPFHFPEFLDLALDLNSHHHYFYFLSRFILASSCPSHQYIPA